MCWELIGPAEKDKRQMTNQAVKKPSRAARVEAAAQEIADKVAALLEQGVMPWRRPWKGGAHGLPFNGATGRRYSGTNILSLWLAEQLGDYDDARWYTFKQAQACGGRVRSDMKIKAAGGRVTSTARRPSRMRLWR